jgi:hypothetical protein
MRLAGAMTIHQGVQAQFAERIISDLARHVDALFVQANGDYPPEAGLAAQNCGKLAGFRRVDIPYTAENAIAVGHELHKTLFSLMDKAKPEMVLFPDADELLPPNVEEIIGLMDKAGAKCVEFPVLVCAGDPDHVIRDASIHAKYHGPQVTLAVWRPGMKFDAKCGFNYPGGDYVGRGIVSPWPKRHLYVATPAAWRARYLFKPQPWMTQPWNAVEYDPNRTWEEWVGTARMKDEGRRMKAEG